MIERARRSQQKLGSRSHAFSMLVGNAQGRRARFNLNDPYCFSFQQNQTACDKKGGSSCKALRDGFRAIE